ncbi:MAG: acetylxylan esterase [Bacteroidales bacterium]|jgi:cephalosporin-C deacetylase-like acetyl esterase|nr:acetylxylan esterase [Bacteroidales bacterium]HNX84800.1 prolyl oligopeptidase family serine peptidase [Bacteroidales bacterium]HPS98349.1 prolyl oligopeptidase family serine peptidase [Bacteroidales bacterium]
MMRRQIHIPVCKALLLTAFFFVVAAGLKAQDQNKVADWKTEFTLRSHLLQEMHSLYDLRRERLREALSDECAINEYKAGCRGSYLRLLGELPPETPLNPEITGRIALGSIVLEKVIIESRPGHHVTANLYLPAGEGPFPAVLFFCGHEMTSKATLSYLETALLFAANGISVMVVDPISQGERVQFIDSEGRRILRGSTTEHTLLNAGAILTGSSVAAWELHDNIRALDYLVSRPEIDSNRIGCMGNSGGGAQTMWFIGFDDRVKAAAPCSFITTREREYELNGTGDGCQQIAGEAEAGLEIADYPAIFAPKPLLILAGRYDFVDYRGTVDAFNELKSVYTLTGHPDRISLFTCDDGHGLSAPKREAALMWFRRWLDAGNSPIVREIPAAPAEEDTWCTPSGQVNVMYPGEITMQEYNRRRVTELDAERRRFIEGNNREALIDTLRRLLSVNSDCHEGVSIETRGSFSVKGHVAEKLIIRRTGEVPLPCHLYRNTGKGVADTLTIWLSHKGKASVAADSTPDGFLPGRYRVVLAADLRGMGETAEKPQDNDPKYYNSEYHNAVLSMHVGQPLPGQRVRDILMILDFISADEELGRMPLKVIASGPAALPAHLAAVLDTRIDDLEMSATIESFSEITDRPVEKEWFSWIIPGGLKYFDLPDLAALRPDLKYKYTYR